MSAWEIGIKHALGKLTLPEDPAKYLPKTFARWSITPIPLEYPEALAAALLPPIHEDPFDRAIIAQAIARKVPILTSDARFEEYGVRVIA